MKTLITGGLIVNEGETFHGTVVLEDEKITEIIRDTRTPRDHHAQTVDATGCIVMPGVIDDHVHFREPGLTEKADMESESRAAAYGGVTSYFEMPNTVPQTTTLETIEEKFHTASQKSHVNYSFFFGATNKNTALFKELDRHRIPGIKLFMGSSTGNMLVEGSENLKEVFRAAKEAQLPLMTHCEDSGIIHQNMEAITRLHGEDPDVRFHPLIRSEEACWQLSLLAMKLAQDYGTQLHIAHISTQKELEIYQEQFQQPNITLEVCVPHLLFCDKDYEELGTAIKCNPAIKTKKDRDALRQFICNPQHTVTIGTDHAPHLLAQKKGGCRKAASGMPMLQFSLVSMLTLASKNECPLTVERVVNLMCHQPAQLFQVSKRGFLRPGYQADIVIVRPHTSWKLTPDIIQSKCGWSPLIGHTFDWRVERTFCNGHSVYIYNKVGLASDICGEEIRFRC